MPYANTAALPESVKNALPARAQRIYLAAVNAALKTYDGDEETAAKVAWSAVKKKYKKQGGRWMPKAQTQTLSLQSVVETTRKLYAAHWAAGACSKYREMVDDLLESIAEDPATNIELLSKLSNLATPGVEITQRVYDTFGYTGTHEHDFPGSLDHHIRQVCAAVHAGAPEYLGRWGYCVAVYPSFVVTCWSGYDDEQEGEIASEYWKIDYEVSGNGIILGDAAPVDVLTIVVPQGMAMGEMEVEGSAQSTEAPFSVPEPSNLSAPDSEQTPEPSAEPPVDTAPGAPPASAPNFDQAVMERLVAQATEAIQDRIRTQFPALYQGTANIDPQWHTDPDWLTQGLAPPGGAEELVQTLSVEITQKSVDAATGVMTIKGIATRGNVLNAMREVYPTQVWQDNLPYLQIAAKEGALLGESDHPKSSPSLDRTCLIFDEVTMQGDDVLFTGRVLPTIPSGQNIQTILGAGGKVDISSRGRGTRAKQDWVDPKTGERHQDVMVIQRGFKCRTFDAVVQGASPGATITDHEMAQQANSACEEIDMEKLDALSQQVDKLTALVTQVVQSQATPAPANTTGSNNEVIAPSAATSQTQETPAPAPVQQGLLSAADVQRFNTLAGMAADFGPIVLERKREALLKTAEQEHRMPRQWLNAYRKHLEMCAATTTAELELASQAILPSLLAMFESAPAANNGAGWKAQQDVGNRPGPQTPNEMIEFMVSEDWGGMQALSDEDSMGPGYWTKEGPDGRTIEAPDCIRTPRRQMRKILQNIADHVDGSWNGHAAITALVQLYQGRKTSEVKEDFLNQVCGDCVTAVGAGGAPSSAIFIFPLVRKVFPQLIAQELSSVQPMDRPDGRIFYLTAYRISTGVDSVDEAGNTVTNRMAINRSESFSDSYSNDPGECEVSNCLQMRLASVAVTAENKKLHAEWTIEELQDLRAYHNLDVAAELVSNLSRQIALEWNQKVLQDLLNNAGAGNRNFGTVNATGYTQKEWSEYLVRYLDAVSNDIFAHRHGDATHVIAGPAAWVKLAASFRAGVKPASPNPEMYAGLTLTPFMAGAAENMKTFKTSFWTGVNQNKILVLRRGADWSDTPHVWAPYIDYVSPVLTSPDTLTQKQGVMSRAAHKVVVPQAIGTITIVPGATGVEL